MPYLTFVVPKIPDDCKQDFLAAWPTISATVKAQVGVAGLTAGPVVAEDGAPALAFKFVQCLAFNTLEDMGALSASAWATQQKAEFLQRGGEEPLIGRFEVPGFPAEATPKPFLQYSTIVLSDNSKAQEARKAWEHLASTLGKMTWGGKSIGSGPEVGLGLLGWDSLDEARDAYGKPEVAAALDAYKSLGKTKNLIIHVRK